MRHLYIIIILLLPNVALAAKLDGVWASVQGGYGLMHASAHDWRKLVWARPSIQGDLGWQRFGLRARYFDFGEHGQFLVSQLYGLWGATRKGTATERHYYIDEYLCTYTLRPRSNSRWQVGMGTSHVKGREVFVQAIFDQGSHYETMNCSLRLGFIIR